MKSKGFTLIELLAVIVILAIIALIATPVILGIINNVKEESNKRSIEMYAKAIENAIAQYQLSSKEDIIGNFYTEDGKNLILIGEEESGLIVDYKGNVVCETIEIYEGGTIYLANCKVDNIDIEYTYGKRNIPDPVAFSTDSWETIAANINSDKYKVGNTREITLTSSDEDIAGTYTVRIANISSDDPVCSTEGYSKTACGFVIEFVDIITSRVVNSTVYSEGGWELSDIRSYINDSIYNSFPESLQNIIIDTNVVSGRSGNDKNNFKTTDKLYLLSTKEVYGKEGTTNEVTCDNAEDETRQLDYYKNYENTDGSIGVTTSNYSGAIKKYNDSNSYWWLRTADFTHTRRFYLIRSDGLHGTGPVSGNSGVSPAFRIG